MAWDRDVSWQSGLLVLRDSFEGSHHGEDVHFRHGGRHLPHVHCTRDVQPADKVTTGDIVAFGMGKRGLNDLRMRNYTDLPSKLLNAFSVALYAM